MATLLLTIAVPQPLLPKEVGGRAPPLGDGPVEQYRAESLRAYSAVACALPAGSPSARQAAQPSQRELMRAFISLIRCRCWSSLPRNIAH